MTARHAISLSPEPGSVFRHLTVTRTEHYRTCPDCEGAGERTVQHDDPQCDEDEPCPNQDCDDGYVTVWRDPLLKLADARWWMARSVWRNVPRVRMEYGAAKVEALSPGGRLP